METLPAVATTKIEPKTRKTHEATTKTKKPALQQALPKNSVSDSIN
jgi:hypothetical protein